MYKVLIIEDDEIIAQNIEKHLHKWDYEVKTVKNFKEIISEFISFEPQLILLDIILPFMNGYHWCSEIRKVSSIPIIFISSASDNMNIVMAMNMGADDFIAKPFDLDVLTAKIHALIRRAYSFGIDSNISTHRDAIFNWSDATICYNNNLMELTKNEVKILQCLLDNVGNVVSRDTMMLKLWNSDNFIDDNTLTVNVARLRKKLEDIGLSDFIKTKKGLGYLVD